MTVTREIPAERIGAFISLARVTQTTAVVVVVRTEAVAAQYRRGVKAAGGDVSRLTFIVADNMKKTMKARPR
jgi:hypothetical protein